MHIRTKFPSALKHAAYSATTLLPGEDRAAFKKLHRDLIAEYIPVGVSEEDIVETMAHYMWRRKNLKTLRIAKLAQGRHLEIKFERINTGIKMSALEDFDPAEREEEDQSTEDRARKELGDTYELVGIGEAATIDGLMQELAVQERLDFMIDKYIKRLLFVRGLKSVSAASSDASSAAPPISLPRPKRAA